MRYAEVMRDSETAAPGTEVVLFSTGKEAAIIGEALAEYADNHKRKRAALEDVSRIALAAVEMVQERTGLSDDDPRVNKLLAALEDGPLNDPEISYQEYRGYN